MIVISAYSAFTLGSNDVSNAASSLVISHQLPARVAGLYGGVFMALGVLTWGRRLVERVGTGIIDLDVPLAASSQLSQAITLTALNVTGYNASINQTIVGGLVGAGSANKENKINRKNVLNIVATWFWSPVLGIASAALGSLILRAIFGG